MKLKTFLFNFGLFASAASLAFVVSTAQGSGDAEPEPAPVAPASSSSASGESKPAKPVSIITPILIAEVQALADAGKYKEAEKKARTLTEKDNSSAEMYNLLGFVLRKQKRFGESVAPYQEALKLKPDFAQAKEYLAVSYLNTKEFKAARSLYEELKSSHPALAKQVEVEAKRLKAKW
jgi:Flp pilus assembly protein TadD